MADPVIRDFRLGVDLLLFSKPVSRAAYLLGKFLGNFFVLIFCQAAFALTMLLLQVFHTSRMVVLPLRVFPYVKHFFLLVVVPYLLFSAVYFTVGTLTRNAKIVYGLAVCYYPVYIAWQVLVLKKLPIRLRAILDPLLMNSPKEQPWGHSPDWVNHIAVSYPPGMIANRLFVIFAAAACLTFLYFRFARTERARNVERFSLLNLSSPAEGLYYAETLPAMLFDEFERPGDKTKSMSPGVILPKVTKANTGARANLNKLIAALGIEFRLLLSERSLVVIIPLAIALSTLQVAFWSVAPDPTYSAGYAGDTAKSLMIFLLSIAIFYTGEAMHRDRDLKFEPILWSQPVPNRVLLWSKYLSTLLLALTLVGLVLVITGILQVLKHNGPIDFSAYARIYLMIMAPNAIFMAATALLLVVWLRDRYLTYAVAIGVAATLFYLYSQGYNHWLYNPLLIQAWDYQTLTDGPNQSNILLQRVYVLLLSFCFIALAHLGYQRRSLTRRANS